MSMPSWSSNITLKVKKKQNKKEIMRPKLNCRISGMCRYTCSLASCKRPCSCRSRSKKNLRLTIDEEDKVQIWRQRWQLQSMIMLRAPTSCRLRTLLEWSAASTQTLQLIKNSQVLLHLVVGIMCVELPWQPRLLKESMQLISMSSSVINRIQGCQTDQIRATRGVSHMRQ